MERWVLEVSHTTGHAAKDFERQGLPQRLALSSDAWTTKREGGGFSSSNALEQFVLAITNSWRRVRNRSSIRPKCRLKRNNIRWTSAALE